MLLTNLGTLKLINSDQLAEVEEQKSKFVFRSAQFTNYRSDPVHFAATVFIDGNKSIKG